MIDGVGAFCKILRKKPTLALGPVGALSPTQLSEVIEQIDIFAQLLMQNCLFMPQKHRQIEVLNLLHKLVLEKKHLVFLNGLRGYEVYLADLKYGNNSLRTMRQFAAARFGAGVGGAPGDAGPLASFLTFEFSPQISTLQCPALEAHRLIEEAVRKELPAERRLALLRELVPLLMRQYIPVFGSDGRGASNRFSASEDALLLAGLIKHGCRELTAIHAQFLPHKSLAEMRNRYKNLTRQKATPNPIKAWKLRESAPLTLDERQNFEKGKLWFGPQNYKLIARYFLNTRSAAFLAQEDGLLEKRAPIEQSAEEALALSGLDPAFDFCPESAEQTRENEEFIAFFRRLLSGGAFANEAFGQSRTASLNLSEPRLAFRSISRRSKRFLEMGRAALTSTKVRVLDDRVRVEASRVTATEVRHAYIDERALDAEPANAPPRPGTVRLTPSFRELQSAALTAAQKHKFAFRFNWLFEKVII